MQITQEQRNELYQQGYNDTQINEALTEADNPQQQTAVDPRTYSQQSSFATKQDDNLIKWQLELNDILERAEHILRGDVPKYINGVLIWDVNPEPDKNPLNEWGVQEIMKLLAMYINRNTILSDYTNDEINYKVFDFGRRLNNFFFMRYDEIGMDNENKRKNYELIVGELVDLVHSSYKRALHGGERRSLREMISVSQNQNMQSLPGQLPGVKERSIFNPARLVKGRFVT